MAIDKRPHLGWVRTTSHRYSWLEVGHRRRHSPYTSCSPCLYHRYTWRIPYGRVCRQMRQVAGSTHRYTRRGWAVRRPPNTPTKSSWCTSSDPARCRSYSCCCSAQCYSCLDPALGYSSCCRRTPQSARHSVSHCCSTRYTSSPRSQYRRRRRHHRLNRR
jgi:hypothetical protein